MRPSNDILLDALDKCYELLRSGADVETCLQRFPEQAAQLQPLLATMAQLQGLRPVPPRAPAVAMQRRRAFMTSAYALAAEKDAPASGGLTGWWQSLVVALSGLLRPTAPRPVPVGLLALLLTFIVVGMLGTLGVTTSATALPGDLLYPVKTATERARLLLTRDAPTRDALLEDFAAERRREAEAIRDLKRPVQNLRLQGVIEQTADGTWRINSLPVIINDQTRIEGKLAPGARVEAVLNAPGDGSLVAVVLKIMPPISGKRQPGPEEAEAVAPRPPPTHTLIPTATRTSEPTVTATTTPTVYLPASVSDPADDKPDRVAVPTRTPTAKPSATATRTATLTPAPTHTPTATSLPVFRLFGRLNKIEDNRWTIDDLTVYTDAETDIQSDPRIGDRVSVTYETLPNGNHHAIGIIMEARAAATPVPISITDRLNSMDGATWIVGRWVVTITGDTTIEGNPQVGEMVEVNGRRKSDSELTANTISVRRLIEKPFQGTIQEIAADHWIVEGEYVIVNENTQIIGEPAIGRDAQVDAVIQLDGSLLARRIYIVPDEPNEPPATPADAEPEPGPTEPPFEPAPVETPDATFIAPSI